MIPVLLKNDVFWLDSNTLLSYQENGETERRFGMREVYGEK